ncbi:MAG: RNA methyltransferase [Gammaproteobacteria bacterium]|nr:RNA methyltransferase [Gammaproteobacteria bacterium]
MFNSNLDNCLNNCRIVLVNTTHPGNVGSTARAMKTMGVSELYLVSSDKNIIDDHAVARASGAVDILEKACLVSTLQEAIVDCHYILGTSTRERTLPIPILTPRAAAKIAIADHAVSNNKIAIVFGQERMGLTNTELAICQSQIIIPANALYSSLNLASAVQLICYELRLAALDILDALEATDFLNNKLNSNNKIKSELATANQMELFYEHLERVMLKTGFLDPKQPKLLMRRLRRVYNRANLCQQELNILRGILAASERFTNDKDVVN